MRWRAQTPVASFVLTTGVLVLLFRYQILIYIVLVMLLVGSWPFFRPRGPRSRSIFYGLLLSIPTSLGLAWLAFV